jgi:hypothetical protein
LEELMPPTREQVQHDVMRHFALGVVRAGNVFDVTGFWRLTIPRYLLTDRDFEDAMGGLVAMGHVEARKGGFHLTAKGAAHLRQRDLSKAG